MSDTWQETVDIDYTYECPTDNYLEGTTMETITENYNGPARLVALIDKETKTVEVTLREWEAYDGRPDRANCDNVVIDCSVDTLLCEVLSDYHNTQLDHPEENSDPAPENRTMKTISTPEGYSEFTWHYPVHPDELYDSNKTTYEDGAWNLVRNKNVDILGEANWAEIRTNRNGMLMNTDAIVGAPDAPDDMKDPIIEMRQKLRDLPAELADIDLVFVPSSFPPSKILEQG